MGVLVEEETVLFFFFSILCKLLKERICTYRCKFLILRIYTILKELPRPKKQIGILQDNKTLFSEKEAEGGGRL